MGRAFEGAFESAIAVVLGVTLGYYCDRWLGTEPVFLFFGFIAGAVAGFRRLLQIKWPDPPGPSSGKEPPGRHDDGRGDGPDDSVL